MSFFPSIPDLELIGLFKRFSSKGIRPLLEYHDEILRSPSELSEGERELIAAYVSSLNDCHYCFHAHRDHAKAWGIDAAVFGDMTIDVEHASLPSKLKPVLDYVRRLTTDPASVAETDVQPIYEAGYSEDALFDIISVTALYNFMNRILEGSGIKKHVRVLDMSDEMRRKHRYKNLWKMIAPPSA